MDLVLPEIDRAVCNLCGNCLAICPEDSLYVESDQIVFKQPVTCTYCALCEEACPQDAIRCEFEITW